MRIGKFKNRIVPLEDFSPNLFRKRQSYLFHLRLLKFYFYQLPNFSECTLTVPIVSQVIYDLFIIAPIVLTIIITAILNFLAKRLCQFRLSPPFFPDFLIGHFSSKARYKDLFSPYTLEFYFERCP